MSEKSEKVFLKRLLIAAPFFLLPLGFSLYLGYGGSLSVGRFEFTRRPDAKWHFQKANSAQLSWAGATIRTGVVYSLGPFRVAHWKKPPKTPPKLANTAALAVATSAAEGAGNNLDNYQTPHIVFHSEPREWTVVWERKASTGPARYIMVVVDDTTAKVHLSYQ